MTKMGDPSPDGSQAGASGEAGTNPDDTNNDGTDLVYSWKDKVLSIPNDTDIRQPDNVEELTAWLVGKAVKSGVNEVREAVERRKVWYNILRR